MKRQPRYDPTADLPFPKVRTKERLDTPEPKLRFPKRRRVKDVRSLRDYHRRFPRCELRSCGKPAMDWPHHIHPNGLGGPGDVGDENYLSLCVLHHVGPLGPHALGHRTWFRRFQGELSSAAAVKVQAALKAMEGT